MQLGCGPSKFEVFTVIRPEPTGTAMVQILASNGNETTATEPQQTPTRLYRGAVGMWTVEIRNLKFLL